MYIIYSKYCGPHYIQGNQNTKAVGIIMWLHIVFQPIVHKSEAYIVDLGISIGQKLMCI